MLTENFIDADLYAIETAILGKKILIRRLREGDGKVFYDLVAENNSLISEYFPVITSALSTLDGAELYVRKTIISWLKQESFSFGLWDKDKLCLVGYLDISRRMPENIGELRFFTDKNRMGEGIMSDTLQIMIPYFFNQLLLNKITIKASTENFTLPTLARKFCSI